MNEIFLGTLGTVLTLTGSGFCNISADVDVKIGEAPCSVKSAKESEITCELVHPHEGGPVDVEVTMESIEVETQIITAQYDE